MSNVAKHADWNEQWPTGTPLLASTVGRVFFRKRACPRTTDMAFRHTLRALPALISPPTPR
ncbi:hypothetical protein BAUCODRAFT_524767 [Baudoinia panamericana UAMH 10762]|uniref:Uncharacterized protein n=1 Tax=Baudoinia panamericana (strain UAMH 10762) TaxID=717646 RepID=M2N7M3_BAUPA|nr:uncharacterized protein BAUCODRAFT_524767 [Baudoinia panamericana UAMH 10762]EMC95064.1 hypothetical protein BAUCODRAFT_524767 [Baudoinia panamericana UAMH 10762]